MVKLQSQQLFNFNVGHVRYGTPETDTQRGISSLGKDNYFRMDTDLIVTRVWLYSTLSNDNSVFLCETGLI